MSKEWSEEVRIKQIGESIMIEIPDGIASVSTTEKGKTLFGGKGVTFYKTGSFVVNLPIEAFIEINNHMKKLSEK